MLPAVSQVNSNQPPLKGMNRTPVRFHRPLIGADPEVFVYDNKDRKYVSFHEHIAGTKREPLPRHYGALQIDGLAVEFNIKPAPNLFTFLRNINHALADIDILLFKQSTPEHEYVTHVAPYAEFNSDIFETVPPENLVLGCEPDYNAEEGGSINVMNPDAGAQLFRTAGGHIHIGWHSQGEFVNPFEEAHMRDCIDLVQIMDHTLYPMSLLFDREARRHQLYGKPGAFRPKPYGVEYRVLSNAWLKNPNLTAWVYNATIRASVLSEYDVRPQAEKSLRDVVENGIKSTHQQILDAYDVLVYKYEMPPLPDNYLDEDLIEVEEGGTVEVVGNDNSVILN